MKIALLLVGYGNVARRFVQLLEESRADLQRHLIDPVIVGVSTRHHGSAFSANGIDLVRWAAEARGPAGQTSQEFITDSLPSLRDYAATVVVETTTLNIESGQPAIAHARVALAGGAHVITANKGPVAFGHRALMAEAAAANRSFLFEGAVMDGLPIFNLVRESMPAVSVTGFRGVVNSTTNFILTAMEQGESYDAALARMQQAGVAEADPSLDVDGWDAAAKASALANVLLDADATPQSVVREGIGPASGPRAVEARRHGRRLKLVAEGSGRGPAVRLKVELQELATDDPLAILDGQANALELHTWPLGRVVITQRDGGLEKTAYALLSDLFTVVNRVRGVA